MLDCHRLGKEVQGNSLFQLAQHTSSTRHLRLAPSAQSRRSKFGTIPRDAGGPLSQRHFAGRVGLLSSRHLLPIPPILRESRHAGRLAIASSHRTDFVDHHGSKIAAMMMTINQAKYSIPPLSKKLAPNPKSTATAATPKFMTPAICMLRV